MRPTNSQICAGPVYQMTRALFLSRQNSEFKIIQCLLPHRIKYYNTTKIAGISFANMSLHEEAAKAYVQALHLTPSAKSVHLTHFLLLFIDSFYFHLIFISSPPPYVITFHVFIISSPYYCFTTFFALHASISFDIFTINYL